MSHILCLTEIRIHHASINVHKFINSSKYSYISIHDDHELMMMNDINMHLNSFNIITNDRLEYIVATFNTNTRKSIYIVCVYGAHSCSFYILQTISQQSHEHCPIIIMGDFNVDILNTNNQPIF
jgi:hypothetical protein